jgi:hypothetical protein
VASAGFLLLEDIKQMLASKQLFLCHAFEFAWAQLDIEHRFPKSRHPRTTDAIEQPLFAAGLLISPRPWVTA